jgi:hypothetical protein
MLSSGKTGHSPGHNLAVASQACSCDPRFQSSKTAAGLVPLRSVVAGPSRSWHGWERVEMLRDVGWLIAMKRGGRVWELHCLLVAEER